MEFMLREVLLNERRLQLILPNVGWQPLLNVPMICLDRMPGVSMKRPCQVYLGAPGVSGIDL